jgi:hypothetical protein
MHRALDLTALAQANGVRNCVIGGPHVMTCDTSEVQGRGVKLAFRKGEACQRWPSPYTGRRFPSTESERIIGHTW